MADEALVTSVAARPDPQQTERKTAPPTVAAQLGQTSSVNAEEREIRTVGRQQLGKASYYGPEFTGRLMANGRRFNPRSTSVAHRTLPFGTTVLVTNLENGRSAMATV